MVVDPLYVGRFWQWKRLTLTWSSYVKFCFIPWLLKNFQCRHTTKRLVNKSNHNSIWRKLNMLTSQGHRRWRGIVGISICKNSLFTSIVTGSIETAQKDCVLIKKVCACKLSVYIVRVSECERKEVWSNVVQSGTCLSSRLYHNLEHANHPVSMTIYRLAGGSIFI